MIFILLISIFVYVCSSILLYTITNGIGPVPSSGKMLKALNQALPEKINGDIFELGCGWGGVAMFLAKKYPNNQVIAYENSPIPWLFAKLSKTIRRKKNLTVCYGNFFDNVKLEGAGLIYCYLFTTAMSRLKRKLIKEAPSGCLIASHTFSIHGWQPERITPIGDFYNSDLLIYRIKSHHGDTSLSPTASG